MVISKIIANKSESENILPFETKNSWLSSKKVCPFPINNHWANNAPKGTNIDNWSNCARFLIFPPNTETILEQISVMTNKLLLISIIESGQLRLAIDTQAKAVMVPIPWDIINAGGINIGNGLMVEAKANFVAWTAKRRVMIKIICLEEIVGFSFFATNIKIPELISASVKVKNQEKISEIFKGEKTSNL